MFIDKDIYDGSFIHKRFAYEEFRDEVSPTGNIVAFRAPMEVKDNLIDLEDALTDDYISSRDAINFCWEIPNLCPLGAVSFQRLFNTAIARILSDYIKLPTYMKGDDIMVVDKFIGSDGKEREEGKASVSITYSKDNVALGHTAININAGEDAPGFAYSTKLLTSDAENLTSDVINYFYDEIRDQFVATTKIIV